MNVEGQIIVEIGKGNPVLRPDWLSDYYLVNIIKLVPVLVATVTKPHPSLKMAARTPLTHPISWCSLIRGSNFGPPGMARLRAFAVKKDFISNK